MAADRIRLAVVAPSHCSSCFQQKPDLMHVDFNAAWDGPVIPGEGVVQHVIDDLIICFDCLRDAAALVDLGSVSAVTAELKRAEEENDELMEKLGALRRHIDNLEAVRNGRPDEILDPPKRQQRRKAVAA